MTTAVVAAGGAAWAGRRGLGRSARRQGPGRRPVAQVALSAFDQSVELDPATETLLEDEPSWLMKLRRSISSEDYEAVARIIMAMGGSTQVDELHRVLAQEFMTQPGQKFCGVLIALRRFDVPPRHAVDLWHLVQEWFYELRKGAGAWNVVVQALVLGGEVEEALGLVRAMESGEDDRLPLTNEKTYTILIGALSETRGRVAAATMISRMALRGLEPDAISFLCMVVVCVRSVPPDLDGAKFWLRKAEDRMRREIGPSKHRTDRRIVVLYNTLMAGYTKLGRLKDSFTLLGSMRCRGIRPDTYTFQILMQACMRFSSYGTEESRQLLRSMQQMGVQPSTANYNMLIRGYARSGQLTLALRVANRMREAGVAWDRYTYFHLISAVIAADQVELSLRLLAKMRRDGVRPTAMHYTLAFIGLAKAGFYEDAGRVFRRLASIKGLANEFAFNMMIGISCERGDIDSAIETMDLMEEKGLQPNAMTFRMLLEGYMRQQRWEDALALETPLFELRRRLERTLGDGAALPAARDQAARELQDPDAARNWTKAYYLLIDAAVWNGEWPRAVQLLEDLVGQGLAPDPRKHSRLLADVNPAVGSGRAFANLSLPSSKRAGDEVDEDEVRLRSVQESWVKWQVPNMTARMTPGTWAGSIRPGGGVGPPGKTKSGGDVVLQSPLPARGRPAADLLEGRKDNDAVAVPPHMFTASFNPDWLERNPEDDEEEYDDKEGSGRVDVLDLCLGGGSPSSNRAYKVVHDYHHATVHRRAMAALQLPAGRMALVRTAPETPETLKKFFDSFGRPGDPQAPVFVFTRPASASLDAVLALLAAAAERPGEVWLLRSEDEEGMESLMEECKGRGDRPLGYSLASTLAGMPAALLLNSRAMVTNTSELEAAHPEDFDHDLRAAIAGGGYEAQVSEEDYDAYGEDEDEEEEDEDEVDETDRAPPTPAAWSAWLQGQGLRQLVRCDPETGSLRLDGAMHQPALSRAELFRARGLRGGQVAIDIWLEETDALAEFGGT